jgi:hypothetical protein
MVAALREWAEWTINSLKSTEKIKRVFPGKIFETQTLSKDGVFSFQKIAGNAVIKKLSSNCHCNNNPAKVPTLL